MLVPIESHLCPEFYCADLNNASVKKKTQSIWLSCTRLVFHLVAVRLGRYQTATTSSRSSRYAFEQTLDWFACGENVTPTDLDQTRLVLCFLYFFYSESFHLVLTSSSSWFTLPWLVSPVLTLHIVCFLLTQTFCLRTPPSSCFTCCSSLALWDVKSRFIC